MFRSGTNMIATRLPRFVPLCIVLVLPGVWGIAPASAAPSSPDNAVTEIAQDPKLAKLVQQADAALLNGDVKLALVLLKEAVLVQPRNGELHARLGIAVLRSGDAIAAERELREARADKAPDEIVVPPILEAMLIRGENNELLAEFPDPQQAQTNLAPDILRARAMALQALGRTSASIAAMDRSLALRRDVQGLLTRAKLAGEQNDIALGLQLADEATRRSPGDDECLDVTVLLLRQQGQTQKALAAINNFITRVPKSVVARSLRIEILLLLKQDARAQQDADWIVAQNPDLLVGTYYQALLTARAKGARAGWRIGSVLPLEFVQSRPDIALILSQMAMNAGSAENGVAILAALVNRHPELTEARVQLASLRLRQNSPDLALSVVEPLQGSEKPEVQAVLAQVYLRLGRYSDAIRALEKATSSGSLAGNEILERQLAQSELQVGSTQKGLDELQQLEARDPGNLDDGLQLAAALARADKLDQALAVTSRLAKDQPKNPLPAVYQSRILAGQGQLEAASKALSQALSADPEFLPALYFRAGISLARGNPQDAAKDLQDILAHDRANVPAWLMLAQIGENEDHTADVIAILTRAIKAAPNDPAPRLALAQFQAKQRKYPDAQATIAGLLRISPNNPDGLSLKGGIQFASGAKYESLQTFRLLVAQYPQSPVARALLAKALDRANDRIGSEDAAAKAIELAPESPQFRSGLIALQITHGKPVDALLTAQAYRSLYPGPDADLVLSGTLILLKRTSEAKAVLAQSLGVRANPNVAVGLSQIELQMGDAKGAAEVLSGVLKKNAGNFEVRRQYAVVLARAGDRAGARAAFETLLKERPDDPVILNEFGLIIQADDPQRALSLLSRAASIAPNSPQIADSLGWMKFQHQDPPGALPLLQRAHMLNSADPQISFHYALALNATGNRPAAKTLLKSVLAKYPKFQSAKDAGQLLARW